MKVSIIIVNFNGARHTLPCVASIRAFAPSHEYEIIVVDNRSSDQERNELKRHLPDCTLVISDTNLGFGGANNLGAKEAKGEILFFLNNDTILTSDVLTPLIDTLDRNRTMGILGPSLQNRDGTFQMSFGLFPSLINEWETQRLGRRFNRQTGNAKEVVEGWMHEWITGAALLIRKECFVRLGGFDPSYFMYFEDVDLCYRAHQLGCAIGYDPECSLVHLGGMSYGSGEAVIRKEYRRSQLRFYDKFRSLPERILLRFYLLVKASIRSVWPGSQIPGGIIGLLFKSHGK